MDRYLEHRGTTFVWNEDKAAANERKHQIRFEEAVTVFDDPLLVLRDASRRVEARDIAIGFSGAGRLLTVVHIEFEGTSIRVISARRATATEEQLYDQ